MKKAFFEDSAVAMAKLIVESIYHGIEENEGVYSAIPMNWKEAVTEDEITKFKEETGNDHGVQIDSTPEFKPRKKFVRKDG